MEQNGRIRATDGTELAWARQDGRGPAVVFLSGFMSAMSGAKATSLGDWCASRGQAFLRFDYAGHGESGGAFTEGTIGRWLGDALAVIDALTEGPLLLVGSSMGGWLALHVALARPGRVAGLVGVAAAPDFTEALMWQAMAPPEQAALLREGRLVVPNQYGDALTITRALIEDGRERLLMGGPIPLRMPVRLLHGQRDTDVPWETAPRLAGLLEAEDVQVTLIKDGDHRLSRPADLDLLAATVGGLLDGPLL